VQLSLAAQPGWVWELCLGSPGAAPPLHIRRERKDADPDLLPLKPPAGIFCDLHFCFVGESGC